MKKQTSVYLVAMAIFWLIFGLITTFYPKLMQLFETEQGISANSPFTNNIWLHEGFDILSVSFLLFALSRTTVSRALLRTIAIVALMPATATIYSLLTTPFWNMTFIVAAISCIAFAVWGFVLSESSYPRSNR